MSEVSFSGVLELSAPDRIQLVEDIWDSIVTVPQPMLLSEAQRGELDRRPEGYHQRPEDGAPREEVKGRILRGDLRT